MTKSKSFLLWLILLATAFPLHAQEDETQDGEEDLFNKTIDTAMAISPQYLPTSYTLCGGMFFHPVDYKEIDTTMNAIGQFDPLNRTENIYQSLGTNGQAHKPMNFTFSRNPGFQYISTPYPLYFKEQDDLKLYKLKTVYTDIAYDYGIATENNFYATHAQNIKDKVNYAFNLRGYRNDGYFSHQRTAGITFDGLIHYEIPSQIYGFKLSYILNNFNMEENGGLLNTQDFLDQLVENLQGYNLKLYNATSKTLTHDLMFRQYVNFMTKSKKTSERKYRGTLMHTFQFKQQRFTYMDFNTDSSYYHFTYAVQDSTIDTMRFYTISNTLQISTFQPYKENRYERYFVHFTGGVTYEYTNYAARNYFGHALIPFAQAHIRLFTVMDIHARISYTLGGYNQNDLNTGAEVSLKLGKNSKHKIGAAIHFHYLSPDYIMTSFSDNHHYWEIQWPKKQKIVQLNPYWQWGEYKVEMNYYMLHHFVYLSDSLTPKVSNDYTNVFQVHLYAPFYLKGFGVKTNLYLQYANKQIIQVPVFAGRLDFFYRFGIFKNKAKLQFGFNAAYNTSYYGYGYYPLLRQFYLQTKVKTGNYFYFDIYAAIQVQRISIFFNVNHVLCGLLGRDYFTTPDYPMANRRFAIGIKWRFFD